MEHPEAIRSSVLWITSRYAAIDGARGREYEVLGEDGRALLAARSTVWGREIVVTDPAGSVVLRLIRSRAFLFNGRTAVLSSTGGALGAVYRSGRFRDATGAPIARFRNTRTFGSQAREALLQGVLDSALGMDGTASQMSSPTAFVCVNDRGVVASLARRKLPFEADDAPASDRARALTRWLPRGVRRWLQDRGSSHGWALERRAPIDCEPLLLLGAALFTVELSHW